MVQESENTMFQPRFGTICSRAHRQSLVLGKPAKLIGVPDSTGASRPGIRGSRFALSVFLNNSIWTSEFRTRAGIVDPESFVS
jgi:hypothetical protein